MARYAAQQKILYGEGVDPDTTIALLDAVTREQVVEVAANVADELSLGVVGPHSADDFR